MVKRFLCHIKIFLLIIVIIVISYVVYNLFDCGFCEQDYICNFVENNDDYQRKLTQAESNGTMLVSLALYNKICLKNIKTSKILLEKSRLLKEKQIKLYAKLAEDGNETAMKKLKLMQTDDWGTASNPK